MPSSDDKPTALALVGLRAIRRQRGLTVEQVAVAAGLCSATVQRLEIGRMSPRRLTLRKLATSLDVTVPELYGLPPAPEPERAAACAT